MEQSWETIHKMFSREWWSFGLDRTLDRIENPDFRNTDKVMDWRNHIHESLIKVWSCLSLESRMIAYWMAEEQASNEEWE